MPRGSQSGVRWSHVGAGFEASLSFFDGFNNLPNIVASVVPAAGFPPAIDVTRVLTLVAGVELARPEPASGDAPSWIVVDDQDGRVRRGGERPFLDFAESEGHERPPTLRNRAQVLGALLRLRARAATPLLGCLTGGAGCGAVAVRGRGGQASGRSHPTNPDATHRPPARARWLQWDLGCAAIRTHPTEAR